MTDEPEEVSAEDLMGDEPTARLHPILSDEEFLAAQSAARKEIEKERKADAKEKVIEAEKNRLRLEEGLTGVSGEEARIVDVTIDLPSFTSCISLNFGQQPFWHGRTYRVPVVVARSLYEQMWRAWRHEDQADGKSLQQKLLRKRDTVLNGRTGSMTNAPQALDA